MHLCTIRLLLALFPMLCISVKKIQRYLPKALFLLYNQSLGCVRRIADALISLQQHGSGDYVGWEKKFSFNLPKIVDRLQQVANKLEGDLEQWKHEIQVQRGNFYELNYYTAKQLLLLREELGRLHESGQSVVKPEAMALLQSISRNITDNEVKACVLSVTTGKDDDVSEDAENNVESTRDSAAPNFNSPTSSSGTVTDINVGKNESSKCSIPHAQRKQHDLSPVQEEILLNIMENFEFREELILLAFDQCEDQSDHNTVATWCTDNQDMFLHIENGEEEEEEEGEEEEEEEEKEPLVKRKLIVEQERYMHVE